VEIHPVSGFDFSARTDEERSPRLLQGRLLLVGAEPEGVPPLPPLPTRRI